MSYAAIASHNIPEGDMPEPDQRLADGHFQGEHEAHADVDHSLNILPAGQDPHHPKVEHEAPSKPEPIILHHAEIPEPHVSEAAPKPTPAPHKGEIHIPQSGEEFEKKKAETKKEVQKDVKEVKKEANEVKEDVKEGVDKAEKKGAEVLDTAEKKTKKALDVAEKKGSELADQAGEALNTAEKKGKKALDAAGAALDDAGKKGKKALDNVEKKGIEALDAGEKKAKQLAKKADAELQKAESALAPYWEKTKDVVLRPGTLGGLMGVVNVGIIGTAGYFAYTRRDQPWDRRIVSGAVAGTLALFGAEGYVADSYLHSPEGRAEAERAKREGSKFWMQTRETVLRPGVAGGLVGALNVAVLSTVGYFSYQNWNRVWDPRIVSAVTVGLVGLSGVEGWAGKAYKDNELPKH